jgi:gamma-glutamyltranspeptidase/glutathione hydrolase
VYTAATAAFEGASGTFAGLPLVELVIGSSIRGHMTRTPVRKHWTFAVSAAAAALVNSLPLPLHAELLDQLEATEAHSRLGMVATGSPEATEAAVRVLERGGNAIDAAVTGSLVLGVADPDASGLGGSTYLIIRFADGHAVAIDGTSPVPGTFNLEALQLAAAAGSSTGHLLAAVPTTLAVVDLALRKYGTITMAEALQPAIDAAEDGYKLSEIQITWTRWYHADILAASDYYRFLIMDDGKTIGSLGDRVCNHDLAQTLRRIAKEGVSSFYRGAIADEIEADMIAHGGGLRKSDLARFRVTERRPVSTTYRGTEVLTFPPPGGGDALVEALNILETYPSEFLAEASLDRHHVAIEAVRIARADRANSVAVMRPAGMSGSSTLSKRHAYARAQMIVPGEVIDTTAISGPVDPECLPAGESTTQVSIIDTHGNVVSLTQTLGRSFGGKVATPGLGFPYNNFLEGFRVDKPQCPVFLRPFAPCVNDMAPSILVFRDGSMVALGTPGSNRIPSILSGVISNLVDRGMSLRESIEAPRVLWGGETSGNIEAEIAGEVTDTQMDALDSMDYELPLLRIHFPADPAYLADFGGVNAALYNPTEGTYTGVTDGRRGGLAQGPRTVARSH